jgi:hypothetical protein
MQYNAPIMAAIVKKITINLFRAENSIILSITVAPLYYLLFESAIWLKTALSLLSESIRKLPDVTTSSPTERPCRIS